MNETLALIIVDMQEYYLNRESNYYKYFNDLNPNCLDYIIERCDSLIIPNILRLKKYFNEMDFRTFYLKICGTKNDRSDLHRFFMESNKAGEENGFPDIYPLKDDPMSNIINKLKPGKNDIIIEKPTFSPFSFTDIDSLLKKHNIETLIFTGLATSQCVETTARDASDRGYNIIHIEDGQADYDENSHRMSLYSSIGVCGGNIMLTDDYLAGY